MKITSASSIHPDHIETDRKQEARGLGMPTSFYGSLKHLVYLMSCFGILHYRGNWKINSRIQHLSIVYMSLICLCVIYRSLFYSVKYVRNIAMTAKDMTFSPIVTLSIVDFSVNVIDACNVLLIYRFCWFYFIPLMKMFHKIWSRSKIPQKKWLPLKVYGVLVCLVTCRLILLAHVTILPLIFLIKHYDCLVKYDTIDSSLLQALIVSHFMGIFTTISRAFYPIFYLGFCILIKEDLKRFVRSHQLIFKENMNSETYIEGIRLQLDEHVNIVRFLDNNMAVYMALNVIFEAFTICLLTYNCVFKPQPLTIGFIFGEILSLTSILMGPALILTEVSLCALLILFLKQSTSIPRFIHGLLFNYRFRLDVLYSSMIKK